MTRRSRFIAYGSAGVVAIAGFACAALSGGTTGQIAGYAIATLALGAIVLLVFYEIGLSEDRDREAEERRRRSERRR